MTWYVSGAINVTNGSDVVVGVGVDWSAFARAGDELVIPGSSTHYEILSVTSAASLRIRPAYQGGTASGMTGYAIKPTASRQLDIATRLSELISNYQGVVSSAGQGKFAAGSHGAPSLRGAADENTGVNFAGDDVFELLSGGVVKGRVTPAGLLDAAGNPLLSAGNAVGLLSQGALCQFDRTAGGDVYRYADGRMRIDTPWVTGYATGRTEVTLPAALSGSGAASMSVIPVDNWDYKVTCYANSAVASFYAENGSTGNLWRISVEGRWKA